MSLKEINKTVSPEWVFNNLNDPNLIILDASINASIDGKQTNNSELTIPNSRHFDLKKNFSDTSSPFPNTVPSPEQFEKESRKLGINSDSQLVVFDNFGIYSSPRVWWLFKVMGHEQVAILDGGLPQWMEKDYPTVKKSVDIYEEGNFRSNYQSNLIIDFDQVELNCKNPRFTIVDARSKGRFNGIENEPRKNLKSGSIPHSINIPYNDVLENGKFKTKDELETIFKNKCKVGEELVFSCGSGLTACIVMLAGEIAHQKSQRVYDGSWTEWAETKQLINNIIH